MLYYITSYGKYEEKWSKSVRTKIGKTVMSACYSW